jgi:hypothetical protein
VATKKVDSKGRLMLGSAFANSYVIIEHISPFEIRVRNAPVIPESEAWLWENREALGMVQRGLKRAKARKFSKDPPPLTLESVKSEARKPKGFSNKSTNM